MNLIANPFPCNFKADGLITSNYFSGAMVMNRLLIEKIFEWIKHLKPTSKIINFSTFHWFSNKEQIVYNVG